MSSYGSTLDASRVGQVRRKARAEQGGWKAATRRRPTHSGRKLVVSTYAAYVGLVAEIWAGRLFDVDWRRWYAVLVFSTCAAAACSHLRLARFGPEECADAHDPAGGVTALIDLAAAAGVLTLGGLYAQFGGSAVRPPEVGATFWGAVGLLGTLPTALRIWARPIACR